VNRIQHNPYFSQADFWSIWFCVAHTPRLVPKCLGCETRVLASSRVFRAAPSVGRREPSAYITTNANNISTASVW
jgi:hypothetical protein